MVTVKLTKRAGLLYLCLLILVASIVYLATRGPHTSAVNNVVFGVSLVATYTAYAILRTTCDTDQLRPFKRKRRNDSEETWLEEVHTENA